MELEELKKQARILWVSEASIINTGFANQSYEICKRFHDNGWHIAELASYTSPKNPKNYKVPWEVYAVEPVNEKENQIYRSDTQNQFGKHKFEEVCLKEKPTHVITTRDWWMDEWVRHSPFRRFFNWIWMALLDSNPQKPEWIDVYNNEVDLLLSASGFTDQVLEKESVGQVNIFDITRPAVDTDVFRPLGAKEKLRKQHGIPEDAFVFLMVARNQKRKLFPELIESFSLYLDKIKQSNKDLFDRSILYISTSYPDVGYNIPRDIFNSGYQNKIYLNYFCENCQKFFAAPWKGEATNCFHCKSYSAHPPNTRNGLTTDQIVQTFNMADVYVQLATCEGIGMPVAEAKACGIPAIGLDNTAVSEQVQTEYGCIPTPCITKFNETVTESNAQRYLPDINACSDNMIKMAVETPESLQSLGEIARKDAVARYSFASSYKVFEKSVIATGLPKHKWNEPLRPKRMPQISPSASSTQMVEAVWKYMNKPLYTQEFWNFVKAIETGIFVDPIKGYRKTRESFTAEEFLDLAHKQIEIYNHWEMLRVNEGKKSGRLEVEIL